MIDVKAGEVWAFNKPYGLTSFGLVAKVRWLLSRKTGIRKIKVGHAGTLDPLATGVLLLCTGRATKQIDRLQQETKEYLATIRLGATTPSFDLEHPIDAYFPTEHITREAVEETLTAFVGEIAQTPPVFSACKIDGKRSYDLARQGKDVALQPKTVVIHEIELVSYQSDELQLRVVCGKGTYIRSLARDIGKALNSGAHLTALCRTRVGDHAAAHAFTIENFEQWLATQEVVKPETLQQSITS